MSTEFLHLLRERILSFCTPDMGEYDILQVGLDEDDDWTYGFFVVFSLSREEQVTLFVSYYHDPWIEYDAEVSPAYEKLLGVLSQNIEYLLSV